jgi:hypothetical protein
MMNITSTPPKKRKEGKRADAKLGKKMTHCDFQCTGGVMEEF